MRLINADALLDFLDVGHLRPPTEICFSEIMIKNIIDMMPTVDAVPVRNGKWLYGESESGHDGYYCSQCGEHIRWRYGEENIDFIRSYNYCPNCGARMDEE